MGAYHALAPLQGGMDLLCLPLTVTGWLNTECHVPRGGRGLLGIDCLVSIASLPLMYGGHVCYLPACPNHASLTGHVISQFY